jgi:MoaA/NifB/PqqE/SkfB family radical SAM enzyme
MKRPHDAIIAVTHRCNARCVMCNIWRSRDVDALRPEHLRKLPPSLRTVNLSGGEPFLRDDLPQFVQAVRETCPKATITISTNGLLTERILEHVRACRRIDPDVRLAVSLDGIGEAHDRIRGVEGAFAAAMETILRLQQELFGGLRLSMTVTQANAAELGQVADLAEGLDLELGVVAAHAAGTHLGVWEQPRSGGVAAASAVWEAVLTRWLKRWRAKQWLRAHFAWHTWRWLLGHRRPFVCRAGEGFFFVQADGAVYSCSVRGRPMGDLVEQPWEAICTGDAAGEARRCARECREGCWMICTARSVYRAEPWEAIRWILANKVRAHLGRFSVPTAPASSASEADDARGPH